MMCSISGYTTYCCATIQRGTPIITLRGRLGSGLVFSKRMAMPEQDQRGEASSTIIARNWPTVVERVGNQGGDVLAEPGPVEAASNSVEAELAKLGGTVGQALAVEVENSSDLGLAADEAEAMHVRLNDILTLTDQRSADATLAALEGPQAFAPSRTSFAEFFRGFTGPGSPSSALGRESTVWGAGLSGAIAWRVELHRAGAPLLLPPDFQLNRARAAREALSPHFTPMGEDVAVGNVQTAPRVIFPSVTRGEYTEVLTSVPDLPPFPTRFQPLQLARISSAVESDLPPEIAFLLPESTQALRIASLEGDAWELHPPSAEDLEKGATRMAHQLPHVVALGTFQNSPPTLTCKAELEWQTGTLPAAEDLVEAHDLDGDSVTLDFEVIDIEAAGTRVLVSGIDTEGAMATPCQIVLVQAAPVDGQNPDNQGSDAHGPDEGNGAAGMGDGGGHSGARPESPPTEGGAPTVPNELPDAGAGAPERRASSQGGSGCQFSAGPKADANSWTLLGLAGLAALLKRRRQTGR